MSTTDSVLQNALLGFAAIYIVLALIRLVLQWVQIKAIRKQVKAIADATEAQKSRSGQDAVRHQETLNRLEAVQQGKEAHLMRSEDLYRQSAEAHQRWSVILSRMEALTEKFEQRNHN